MAFEGRNPSPQHFNIKTQTIKIGWQGRVLGNNVIHGHRKEIIEFKVSFKVNLIMDFQIWDVATTFPFMSKINASEFF